MNRARVLTGLGYGSFFLLWFILFAYWTFPYERLSSRLADFVKASGTGYEIEIGSLAPYWLSGVELENVKVFEPGVAQPAAGGELVPSFVLKEARVRLSLLSALIGWQTVRFDMDIEGGELSGKVAQSGDERELELEIEGLDLGKVSALHTLVPLPATGTLNGEIDLSVGADPTKSSGSAELEIKDFVIGDGKAKLSLGAMGGLTVDPVEVGVVSMALEVKDGVGKVEKLSSDGKDLQLAGSGEVTIGTSLQRTRLDLLVGLKVLPAYRTKSERTQALMSLLEAPGVAPLQAARAPDGFYRFKILGSLAAARAVPAGGAAASGGRRGRRGADDAAPPP